MANLDNIEYLYIDNKFRLNIKSKQIHKMLKCKIYFSKTIIIY